MDSDVFGAFEEGIKSLQLSKWVFSSWFKTKLLWSFVVGGGMGGGMGREIYRRYVSCSE